MDTIRHSIQDFVKSLHKRAHRHTFFQNVIICLFFGMCILAVLSLGNRFTQYPFSMTIVTLIVILCVVVSGSVLSFRNRKTVSEIASFVDEKLILKERVSTALDLIQQNRQGELVDLQILDTAEEISNVDTAKIQSFAVPKLLKWISIPILIIVISFVIPRQYELPKPLTVAESKAIAKTINNLSEASENINPIIQEQIKKTIKQLKNVDGIVSAQEHLRKLNREVRKQNEGIPDVSTITQQTQHFKGMDSTALVDELERLATQDELTPELRAELEKLFTKMKENFPNGELRSELEQVQGKTVSQDKLREIANALNQANLLNKLETQLIESRKDIALASIQTEKPNGALARSDSAPGEESGNKEVQGSLVSVDNTTSTQSANDIASPSEEDETEKPVIGSETESFQANGNKLRLSSQLSANTETITRVFSGNVGDQRSEPEYLPFTNVVLNAQRNYAQAIENDSVPLRYRLQIQNYLEEIAKINER